MHHKSPQSEIFVSVIIPLQNDADTLGDNIEATAEILAAKYTNYEIIIVDNNSSDNTADIIIDLLQKLPCIRYIRLSRTYDHDTAVFAGLEVSIGDYCATFTISVDDPAIIPRMVEEAVKGADIVQGVSRERLPYSLLSRGGHRLFYWYNQRILKIAVPERATYLILLNRRATNALTKTKSKYRHIRHVSSLVGFKIKYLKYSPNLVSLRHRRKLRREMELAMEIAISYSSHPLRFVSRIGLVAGLLNIAYAFYVVAVNVVQKNVAEGWTSLSLQTAGMFFLMFLILSVLSEYVARIVEETRGQPAYHIMEELTSNVLVVDADRRNIVGEERRVA